MSFIVYKHTTPNNKVYIGITSQSPNKRWKNGHGYKKNKLFYSAIKKFGWDNITHEILFSELTKEEAEQKEIELIDCYKSNQREYGYNRATGGRVNCGFSISEETRKKLSKALKGKPLSYKRVVSEELKRRLRKINLGKHLSEEAKQKISSANKGKIRSDEYKKAVIEREQNKVNNILQIDFNGNIINIFNSIHEASRKTGVDASKICAVCKRKRNYAKGFIWVYEQEKQTIEDRVKIVNKKIKKEG